MFRNRPYGLEAIWKAIQRLGDQEGVSDAATGQPGGKKPASGGRVRALKVETRPRKTQAKAKPTSTNGFREGSKAAEALKLCQRKSGVSLADLMERFGWQSHSVRGFVSTLKSKHG